jgi:predicted nuclease of predicted toxin-antitoxin system
MFVKHKPRLYFDENFPVEAIEHFRTPHWKKRLWITSADEQGHRGQSDRFHCSYCQRHGYTLVTLDDDFNDDRLYPFTHDNMPGIIIIKAKSADVVRIANMLVTFFPSSFDCLSPRESWQKQSSSWRKMASSCAGGIVVLTGENSPGVGQDQYARSSRFFWLLQYHVGHGAG